MRDILRQIRLDLARSPNSDGLRLIYADYLEDSGEWEAAEIVRGDATIWKGKSPGWSDRVTRILLDPPDSLKISVNVDGSSVLLISDDVWGKTFVQIHNGLVDKAIGPLKFFRLYATWLATHPLTSLIVDNRTPTIDAFSEAGQHEYAWLLSEDRDIFDEIDLPVKKDDFVTSKKVADTEELARSAFNDALLKMIRTGKLQRVGRSIYT